MMDLLCHSSSVELDKICARVSSASMRKLDLKSQLGTAIRTKRNDLGISQEELADRAGLHRTYISDIERGARNLSLESIDKLAGALQISIASLFVNADDNGNGHQHAPANNGKNLVDILLVEDNESDIELTLQAFKQANLSNRVHVARDGADAIDYVFCRNSHSNRDINALPDVILLDLNLPKVSGIEVLRTIKSDPRMKDVHVVVLTVSQSDRDIDQCRKLGAETYIVKPVNFNSLGEVTAQLNLYWALMREDNVAAS
jgi:two-component system, response regulator